MRQLAGGKNNATVADTRYRFTEEELPAELVHVVNGPEVGREGRGAGDECVD